MQPRLFASPTGTGSRHLPDPRYAVCPARGERRTLRPSMDGSNHLQVSSRLAIGVRLLRGSHEAGALGTCEPSLGYAQVPECAARHCGLQSQVIRVTDRERVARARLLQNLQDASCAVTRTSRSRRQQRPKMPVHTRTTLCKPRAVRACTICRSGPTGA